VNRPDDLSASLGERLRQVRVEMFGPDEVEEVARRLGVAPQTWRNFEEIGGLISPAQLLLFADLTGTNPLWLRRGQGPKYRADATSLKSSADPTPGVD